MFRYRALIGPTLELLRSMSGSQFEGVLVVLVYENQILSVQHRHQPRGCIELPGGGVKDERAIDAAVREIRSELSLKLAHDELIPLGHVRPNDHRVIYGFACELPSTDVWKHGREIEQLIWRTLDPHDEQLSPVAREFVQRYLDHQATQSVGN